MSVAQQTHSSHAHCGINLLYSLSHTHTEKLKQENLMTHKELLESVVCRRQYVPSGDLSEEPAPPLLRNYLAFECLWIPLGTIYELVSCIESRSLVCRVVGNIISSRQSTRFALLALIEIVNVPPLG